MTNTCQQIVERRSGAGLTTGAGPRSGKYEATCGRPTDDGERLCGRCKATEERRRDKAHGQYHRRAANQGWTQEEIEARCPICRRSTT